jgi:hypothetical protein
MTNKRASELERAARLRKRFELNFLGAVIVFSTFVVKDAIKDRIKDTIDSVQQADNTFRIKNQGALIYKTTLDETGYIKEILTHMQERLPWNRAPATDRETESAYNNLVEELSQNGAELSVDLENSDHLRRLIEELPDDDLSLSGQLHTIQKRCELVTELHTTKQDWVLRSVSHTDRNAIAEATKVILSVKAEILAIQGSITQLGHDALKRSNEVRHTEERKLRYFTWASYALYLIGWSVALFGRLLGVDPFTVEE